MFCERSSELQAFHDGELSPEESRALEGHVGSCAACRTELAALRAISLELKRMEWPRPDDAAMARWMEAAAMVRDRGVRRLAGWLTAAAAGLLVFAMIPSSRSWHSGAPAAGSIDTAVLMLPGEEAAPPTFVIAQWMATDLSLDEKGGV